MNNKHTDDTDLTDDHRLVEKKPVKILSNQCYLCAKKIKNKKIDNEE